MDVSELVSRDVITELDPEELAIRSFELYSHASDVIPRRTKGKGQVIFRQVVELGSFRVLAGQQPLRLSRDPHLQSNPNDDQRGIYSEHSIRHNISATSRGAMDVARNV
ncbi:hypothetical protein C0Q70_01622 [Pomacea canaliculata]|uniref:Uncharacterized protein n=1 Tax=Pomacea canaliculata TaxID=400727 RepID=A0A2T7Q029_POMCA|nr:hypothetical protein C0Q70_01622 [Pomacea canaliculata]